VPTEWLEDEQLAAVLPQLGGFRIAPRRIRPEIDADHPGLRVDFVGVREDGTLVAIETTLAWPSEMLGSMAAVDAVVDRVTRQLLDAGVADGMYSLTTMEGYAPRVNRLEARIVNVALSLEPNTAQSVARGASLRRSHAHRGGVTFRWLPFAGSFELAPEHARLVRSAIEDCLPKLREAATSRERSGASIGALQRRNGFGDRTTTMGRRAPTWVVESWFPGLGDP
jgi:hypothetical protein